MVRNATAVRVAGALRAKDTPRAMTATPLAASMSATTARASDRRLGNSSPDGTTIWAVCATTTIFPQIVSAVANRARDPRG
jgi:hypothetical protein